MGNKMTMLYWKGEKHRVGTLLEHPEIMDRGRTVKEPEANLREACLLMGADEVPESHQTKVVATRSERR